MSMAFRGNLGALVPVQQTDCGAEISGFLTMGRQSFVSFGRSSWLILVTVFGHAPVWSGRRPRNAEALETSGFQAAPETQIQPISQAPTV